MGCSGTSLPPTATQTARAGRALRSPTLTFGMPPTLAAGPLPSPAQLFVNGTDACSSGGAASTEVAWVCDPTKSQDQLEALFINCEPPGAPSCPGQRAAACTLPLLLNRLPPQHMHRPRPCPACPVLAPCSWPQSSSACRVAQPCHPHRKPAANTCRISVNVRSAKAWWVGNCRAGGGGGGMT